MFWCNVRYFHGDSIPYKWLRISPWIFHNSDKKIVTKILNFFLRAAKRGMCISSTVCFAGGPGGDAARRLIWEANRKWPLRCKFVSSCRLWFRREGHTKTMTSKYSFNIHLYFLLFCSFGIFRYNLHIIISDELLGNPFLPWLVLNSLTGD